jgi:phage virion morphogenesis protein
MDELQALEEWAGALLAQMQPAARREAMKDIARELRRSQQKRIAEQRNPDGTPYEPRKARAMQKNLRGKAGRIKRRAMFAKMRTARFLKVETDAEGLAIGFAGRVARLARIHQDGETAPVEPGGPDYKYPVRQLLGFTQQDRELIRDKLLAHLVK